VQIYKITNLINGKYYIGKDKNDRNSYFGSGTIIKQAINKYGKSNFKKTILEKCNSNEELSSKEIFWIKKLNSTSPNGYNITTGGEGGDTTSNHPNKKNIIKKRNLSNKNKKRSEEFCKKLSKQLKQYYKNIDKETLKNRSLKSVKNRQKRINEQGYTKRELSAQKQNAEFLIKLNQSKEGRERVSKQWKGKTKKPFTKEHRLNIGKASKGRKIPGKPVEILNIKYESLHSASRKLNIPLNTLRNRLLSINFQEWNYVKE